MANNISTFQVENLTCSRLDPNNPDKCVGYATGKVEARHLLRWMKGPFKDYTWAFCSGCTEKSLEMKTAELITDIAVAQPQQDAPR